jgi:SAM-dependent methyltransferase
MAKAHTGGVLKRIKEYNGIADETLSWETSKGLCQNGTPIPFYDFESAGQSYNWSDELDNTLDEEITGIHPIDFYERKTVADYIKTHRRCRNPKDESIICDFGCSLGYMLKEIKKDEPDALMLGADVIDVSLAKLNKSNPDFMLFKLDIRHIAFPNEMLDAAVCLNVLEHIDDDEKVISEVQPYAQERRSGLYRGSLRA